MIAQHDKVERRWSRFSMRTVTVLVTLVCVYLACWRFTTTAGVAKVIRHVYGYDTVQLDDSDVDPWCPMPMIVRLDEPHLVGLSSVIYVRRYYFWYFFGTVRLPFQGDDPPIPAVG